MSFSPQMAPAPHDAQHDVAVCNKEAYCKGSLSITVLGASGDLAKRKTFPSLFELYTNGFLPKSVAIVGYARSKKTDEALRASLREYLPPKADSAEVDAFLSRVSYHAGGYDSEADFSKLVERLNTLEGTEELVNRLFYLAVPPTVFLASAASIKKTAVSTTGFTRLIVEKPFGHDLASARELSSSLGALFSEDHIYRIDHYLGKEMVQNLLLFRFGNTFLEPLFNNRHVENVRITLKENIGTQGRGGYFTSYGIIRDVVQNHLMQVLSILAMEPPPRVAGEGSSNMIRDQKVRLLQTISGVELDDIIVGQYTAGKGQPGFLEDDSIAAADREKAKLCPTFAVMALKIHNPRWEGVPFFVKAGKGLDEKKVEIRIQFKDPPAGAFMFGGQKMARNELVLRLQPNEAVYMKVNVKTPGLSGDPVQSELDLTYNSRYKGAYNPDAYTRLILEALRGNMSTFVRSDELEEAWRIFDPILRQLEHGGEGVEPRVPLPYEFGTRGPAEADKLLERKGFQYESTYEWTPAHRM